MAPLPFLTPCSILITGATNCGKTVMTSQIIKKQNEIFSVKPKIILYYYTQYQPLFSELEQTVDNLHFRHGIPTESDINSLTQGKPLETSNSTNTEESGTHNNMVNSTQDHYLIIMDDMMTEVGSSKFCLDLFIKISHHLNISLIFITQNLFSRGKFSRTILLNITYTILYKNPRDFLQIKEFGRRLGQQDILTQAYEDATKNMFGYLLIDLSPKSNELYKYRTDIFHEPIIYLYK